MKIVVSHVPAGSGHQKAAEALVEALTPLAPDAEIILADASEWMDKMYQWSFGDGYIDLIEKVPALWGKAYFGSDAKFLRGLVKKVHHFNNAWHGKALFKQLEAWNADAVVSTHFFPGEAAAWLKKKGKIQSKIYTVVTDYFAHAVWTPPGVDAYLVGSEWTEDDLLERGIPKEKIHIFGIPISPRFEVDTPKAELFKKLGLDPDLKTLLVGAGGCGTGPVYELVQALESLSTPAQILVVSGKNEALYKDIKALEPTYKHKLHAYGFVDNMHELMSIADCLVTKPGGLTSTEAMNKDLPMLLVDPVPGQESRNADIFEQAGIALLAKTLEEMPPMVENIFADETQLNALKAAVAKVSQKHSAKRMAEWILNDVKTTT